MYCFRSVLVATFVLAGILSFEPAHAQFSLQPGVRIGYYTDNNDFFFGADMKTGFLLVNANANAEYVFVDNAKMATFNLDGTIDFGLIPGLPTWVGAGIGLLYADPDNADSQTDGIFNLLLGGGLNKLPLSPYVQLKYILAESDQFVVGAGIRF
jgi:hypothetical protein